MHLLWVLITAPHPPECADAFQTYYGIMWAAKPHLVRTTDRWVFSLPLTLRRARMTFFALATPLSMLWLRENRNNLLVIVAFTLRPVCLPFLFRGVVKSWSSHLESERERCYVQVKPGWLNCLTFTIFLTFTSTVSFLRQIIDLNTYWFKSISSRFACIFYST